MIAVVDDAVKEDRRDVGKKGNQGVQERPPGGINVSLETLLGVGLVCGCRELWCGEIGCEQVLKWEAVGCRSAKVGSCLEHWKPTRRAVWPESREEREFWSIRECACD